MTKKSLLFLPIPVVIASALLLVALPAQGMASASWTAPVGPNHFAFLPAAAGMAVDSANHGSNASFAGRLDTREKFFEIFVDADFGGEAHGVVTPSAIPEAQPYALLLAGVGALGFMWVRRRGRLNP